MLKNMKDQYGRPLRVETFRAGAGVFQWQRIASELC